MTFYRKQDLISQDRFDYENPADPESALIYTTPTGKSGNVFIRTQLRDLNGAVLTNSAGTTISATEATVTVQGTAADPIGYEGSFGAYSSGADQPYESTSAEDVGTISHPAIGHIDVDSRATPGGTEGVRWNVGIDNVDAYIQAYKDWEWTLTVTTTQTTNGDPPGKEFVYYWPAGTLRIFASGQVQLDKSALLSGSSAFPPNTGNAGDTWGDNPTYTLYVAGTTPPPPPVDPDSYRQLAEYLDTGGNQDLGGLTYTIQNAYELDLYGADSSAPSMSQNATLTNGTITGCLNPSLVTWSSIGGGVYKGVIDSDVLASANWSNDTRFQLQDTHQTDSPLLQMRPTPSSEVSPYRFTWTEDWIWYEEGGVNDGGVLVTFTQELNDEGVLVDTDIIDYIQFPSTSAGDALFGQINAACNGALSSNSGWQDLTIVLHHLPSLITFTGIDTWDLSTRTMTFEKKTIQYSNYFKFAFSGVGSDNDADAANALNAGEYMMSRDTSTLYYHPVDASQMASNPPIYVPAIGNGIQITNDATLTCNGIEFFGSRQADVINAFFLLGRTNGEEKVVLNNCDAHEMLELTKDVIVEADGCKFNEFINRAITAKRGTFTNNYFGVSYNKSVINLNKVHPSGTSSLVEKNFFSLAATAHGQCVAGYNDGWQSITIKNNIFYNCRVIFSYQPTPTENTPYGDVNAMGTWEFSNNLVYVDKILIPVESGQAGMSFNGKQDSDLNATQKVRYLSNTVLVDPDYLEATQPLMPVNQSVQLVIAKHVCSEVLLANNILPSVRHTAAGNRSQALTENPSAALNNGHASLNNAKYSVNTDSPSDLTQSGFGQSDLPSLTFAAGKSYAMDFSGVFDTDTFVTSGDWANGATDSGGTLGVRWSSIPSASDLATLNADNSTNWASTYAPQAYPSPPYPTNSSDIVEAGDDFRS